MNKVIVKQGKVLSENGEVVDSRDVYGKQFLAEVNVLSDRFHSKSDYINEIFLYFFIPFFEKLTFIKVNNIKEIILESALYECATLWCRASREAGLKFSISKKFVLYTKACFSITHTFLFTILFSILLPIYILFKFKNHDKSQKSFKSFAVVRSPASLTKMSFLKADGVEFFCDDLTFKFYDGQSLYRAPFARRVLAIFVVPFFAFRDFFSIFNNAKKRLGFLLACDVANYYIKRIPHKVNFEFYLNTLFKSSQADVFYTGNKEDRFAILEGRLCAKYNLKCICIPHGLEYSFKLPSGLVGDKFYCNSANAKKYLQNLYMNYKTEFIFDSSVVVQMLSKNRPEFGQKKLIFFPESREIEKNLIIIKSLDDLGLRYYVKLHVKDRLDNYSPYVTNSMIINDFDEAISNSICLARKSTVLLEAIYNNSIPVAVLFDNKDRAFFEFMFPSLNDENIFKIYSIEELKILLKKLLPFDDNFNREVSLLHLHRGVP